VVFFYYIAIRYSPFATCCGMGKAKSEKRKAIFSDYLIV